MRGETGGGPRYRASMENMKELRAEIASAAMFGLTLGTVVTVAFTVVLGSLAVVSGLAYLLLKGLLT